MAPSQINVTIYVRGQWLALAVVRLARVVARIHPRLGWEIAARAGLWVRLDAGNVSRTRWQWCRVGITPSTEPPAMPAVKGE